MHNRIVFIIVVTASLTLAACSGGTGLKATLSPGANGEPTLPTSVGQPTTSAGAQLYAANCQVCHGDRQGEGGTGAPVHNHTGHTWHHPDAQLKEWVLDGKLGLFSQMPGFNDKLTEEEVEAILAHMKTWWTEEQRQQQADVSSRYQEALERQGRTR